MPIIAITNKLYTGSGKIIQALVENFEGSLVTDVDIMEKTHQTYPVKLATLKRVAESKQIAFNNFTHEQEKCLAALKKTLSDLVGEGNCVFAGLLAHLIPREITHVMRILINEDRVKRLHQGMTADNITKKQAEKRMDLFNMKAFSWTQSLFGKNPWDETLYDRTIHLAKFDPETAIQLVSEYFVSFADNDKNPIQQKLIDFKLSADIELALSDIGQGLLVKAGNGHVMVTIDKKVKRLTTFQQKIIQAVEACPGVTLVETKIGKNYYK
ncbi:MAG: cytidylate kinase family protein [Proteobacteria bacterium]|nr:cytidylate kinase-like family protein [Desulfobacula sp.]MBU4131496.1 cytidylate kinase family protein [Pseudomonadota bacterium]